MNLVHSDGVLSFSLPWRQRSYLWTCISYLVLWRYWGDSGVRPRREVLDSRGGHSGTNTYCNQGKCT